MRDGLNVLERQSLKKNIEKCASLLRDSVIFVAEEKSNLMLEQRKIKIILISSLLRVLKLKNVYRQFKVFICFFFFY